MLNIGADTGFIKTEVISKSWVQVKDLAGMAIEPYPSDVMKAVFANAVWVAVYAVVYAALLVKDLAIVLWEVAKVLIASHEKRHEVALLRADAFRDSRLSSTVSIRQVALDDVERRFMES